MPYALCPMPYALCPVVPHLSEKGYTLFLKWVASDCVQYVKWIDIAIKMIVSVQINLF